MRDVTSEMGHAFNPSRFIPFVMIHEFEALLFSVCQGFAEGIGQELSGGLGLSSHPGCAASGPEEIDDSPLTAPSKRITKLVPGYQKPLMGVLAASKIGLETMRSECPHFATNGLETARDSAGLNRRPLDLLPQRLRDALGAPYGRILDLTLCELRTTPRTRPALASTATALSTKRFAPARKPPPRSGSPGKSAPKRCGPNARTSTNG